MAKKLVKHLAISTLTLAAVVAPLSVGSNMASASDDAVVDQSTIARATSSDGVPAWSTEELTALDAKTAGERVAKCGNDSVCRDNLYYQQRIRGGFYQALYPFNSKRFLITAVYPEQNKIRIMFHDEDEWKKVIGFNEPAPYTEAYVAWFEKGFVWSNDTWINNALFGRPTEGVHAVYAKNVSYAGMEEEGEYMDGFPSDVEIEVYAPESQLDENIGDKLNFKAKNGGVYDTQGLYEYGDCHNSPDYSPEIGCHLFYDQRGRFFYLPIEIHATPEQYVYISEETHTSDGESQRSGEGQGSDGNQGSGEGQGSGSESGNEGVGGGTDAGVSSGDSVSDDKGGVDGATADGVVASAASVSAGANIGAASNADTVTKYTEKIAYRYLTLASNPTVSGDSDVDKSVAGNESPKGVTTSVNSVEQSNHRGDLPTANIEIPTSGEVQREFVFPWWFIALLAAVDVVVIWFFWPRRRKQVK